MTTSFKKLFLFFETFLLDIPPANLTSLLQTALSESRHFFQGREIKHLFSAVCGEMGITDWEDANTDEIKQTIRRNLNTDLKYLKNI